MVVIEGISLYQSSSLLHPSTLSTLKTSKGWMTTIIHMLHYFYKHALTDSLQGTWCNILHCYGNNSRCTYYMRVLLLFEYCECVGHVTRRRYKWSLREKKPIINGCALTSEKTINKPSDVLWMWKEWSE